MAPALQEARPEGSRHLAAGLLAASSHLMGRLAGPVWRAEPAPRIATITRPESWGRRR